MTSSTTTKQQTIVVLLDGSPDSNRCINYLSDFVAKQHKIVLLNCIERIVQPMVPDIPGVIYFPNEMTDFVETVKADKISRSRFMLAQAKHKLIDEGKFAESSIDIKTAYCAGELRDEVLKNIQSLNADAAIIGSRGMGAVRRMFVGSLSTFLIHNLDIPVTVVRAPSSSPAVTLDDDKQQD